MKRSQLIKLIFGIVINYFILRVISLIISHRFNLTLEDTTFIVGLTALLIGIWINIMGNSMRVSIQFFGNLNSQYVSRVDLEAQKHKITFSATSIVSGAIIISSLLILIAGYIL